TVQRRDDARERGRQLDGALGRLHLGHRLVSADRVAHGDEPLHERRLGESLAEVGQPEDTGGRGGHPAAPCEAPARSSSQCSASIASRMRSASGRYQCSSLGGAKGVSNPVTRRTGASRYSKQRSKTRAWISLATLTYPGASATTTARPVARTAAVTVASSKGDRLRTSMTCTLRPSDAAVSAASSATGTMAAYASTVTSVPSRAMRARPISAVIDVSTGPFDQYSFFGSRKTTGSGEAIAARSREYASCGL